MHLPNLTRLIGASTQQLARAAAAEPAPLSRPQKNALFQAIEEAGLDAREFAWVDPDKPRPGWSKLDHRKTASSFSLVFYKRLGLAKSLAQAFAFRFNSSVSWFFRATVATEVMLSGRGVGRWDEVLEAFGHWLREVKAAGEPDLWEALRAPDSDSDSGFFSPDERAEIAQALREIADHLAQQRRLSEKQREALQVTFVLPLEEASGKLTKGQWKAMLVGALINECVQLGLHSDTVHTVFNFAAQLVGHLFGSGPPALPVAN